MPVLRRFFFFQEAYKFTLPDQSIMYKDVENLRWFMLPSEALDLLQTNGRARVPDSVPFTPKVYEPYRHRDWNSYVARTDSKHSKNTAGIVKGVVDALGSVEKEDNAVKGKTKSWRGTSKLNRDDIPSNGRGRWSGRGT
jgi:hypothetical protein